MVVDLPVPDVVEVEPMLRKMSEFALIPNCYLPDHSPVLDLLRHSQECLLDVGGILCRGFQERNRELVGEVLQDKALAIITKRHHNNPTHLGHAVLHNLLAGQVRLVSNKELVDALRGVAVNLLQPLLDVGESVCIGSVCCHERRRRRNQPLSVTS